MLATVLEKAFFSVCPALVPAFKDVVVAGKNVRKLKAITQKGRNMSATSITKVMSELFSAPLDAVVHAEAQYRRIWAEWMATRLAMATDATGKALRPGVDFNEILKTAPAVDLDGVVELAVTMRVAGVREFSGGLGVGLAVGPVHASGNFGFMSRTTQESVFQAQAKFTLSNTGRNLTGLLDQMKLTTTNPENVATAITELGKYREQPKLTADGKGIEKPQPADEKTSPKPS